MRLMAIDFGTKKCGIAISDPLKIISQPLKIIFYENNDYLFLIQEIKKIMDEYKPFEKIILGLPKNIDNSLSPTGKKVIKFEKILKKYFDIEIILFDEKYSTKAAKEIMKEMNLSNKKKKESKDSLAAQKILEEYISKN